MHRATPSPWARNEPGNDKPNTIWPTTRPRGDLHMRETFLRRTWRHSPNQKRENADPRARTKEAHGHTWPINWAMGKSPLPRPNCANHRPIIQSCRSRKTQYAGWGKKNASIQENTNEGEAYPKDTKQGRRKTNDTIRNAGQKMTNENAGQTRQRNAPERTRRINNGKTWGGNKRGKTYFLHFI